MKIHDEIWGRRRAACRLGRRCCSLLGAFSSLRTTGRPGVRAPMHRSKSSWPCRRIAPNSLPPRHCWRSTVGVSSPFHCLRCNRRACFLFTRRGGSAKKKTEETKQTSKPNTTTAKTGGSQHSVTFEDRDSDESSREGVESWVTGGDTTGLMRCLWTKRHSSTSSPSLQLNNSGKITGLSITRI